MEHPITPPPELVKQWLAEGYHQDYCNATEHAITKAARWGADQGLEACCEWIASQCWTWTSTQLRAARRPKPPSLKEQAFKAVDASVDIAMFPQEYEAIRRALKALPDD